MIKIYSSSKGVSLPLVFLAGLVLSLFVFFWGMTKIMELLLPLLIVVSYLMIIVFVFAFLPATLIKYLRPQLCTYSILMSYGLSTATWILSFIFVLKTVGVFGIIFLFLPKYLTLVALLAAACKGAWHVAEHLSLWVIFSFAMKFYSQWLLNLNARPLKKTDVIDISPIKAN